MSVPTAILTHSDCCACSRQVVARTRSAAAWRERMVALAVAKPPVRGLRQGSLSGFG